jgi:hypothetical protein
MADLNSEFETFHSGITLAYMKKESLRKARDAIRDRIRKYFQKNLEVKIPKFFGQGSYAMGTTVNPLDGEFDIDDGVYLQNLDRNDDRSWPKPETVHHWLVNATEGHTKEKPIDKRTCVRVRYAGQYHVDLPSYSELNGQYMLAEKRENGWHRSDSLSLTLWFQEHVQANGEQLRRAVQYLKAWADFQSGRRGKMPSGLILTVLTVKNFYPHERDDVSFSVTVGSVSNAVRPIFSVFNPIDSEEEFTARLSERQKKRFQEAINDLASDAANATKNDDREDAPRIWRRQFGDRFPVVEKNITISQRQEDIGKLATFYAAQKPAKPWAKQEWLNGI